MINIEAIKQRISIYNQIVGKTPKTGLGRVKVFSMEAGLGKTTITIEALRDLNEADSKKKSLLVVPFIDDAKKLKAKLGCNAVALHKANKKDYEIQTILDTPVLIITHARYKDLCNQRNRYKPEYRCLVEGRNTLIIDEEIRIEDSFEVSLTDYLILRNSIKILDPSLLTGFDKAFQEVARILQKAEKGVSGFHVYVPQRITNEERDYLRRLKHKVESKNGNHKFFEYLSSLQNERENYLLAESYRELAGALENLIGLIESRTWFYDERFIRCVDTNMQYVLLENNIILDASASVSSIYKLMPMTEVVQAKRIVSYANSTLNVCYVGTSKSKKKKNSRIFRDVAFLAQEKLHNNPESKLLIIGSADDVGGKKQRKGKFQRLYSELCKQYKGRLDFINFKAMRGKNNWADYDCCLVIHTPYYPNYYYALMLNNYRPDIELSDRDFTFRYSSKMGRLVYMRKELDDLCATMMSADVYQAVRRINRKGRKTAQIFLFTSAKCLVKTVVENMPDIQVREIRLPCQKDTKKNCSGKSNVENPLQIKLKLLLMELTDGKHREHECSGLPGHYKKGWCMAQIGCNGHFSRQLKAVQEEMLRIGIAQDQHKLIVLKHVKD